MEFIAGFIVGIITTLCVCGFLMAGVVNGYETVSKK